jgi:hypothetical protein
VANSWRDLADRLLRPGSARHTTESVPPAQLEPRDPPAVGPRRPVPDREPEDTSPRPDHGVVSARSAPPDGRHLGYAPNMDGRADPGEIVWAWVPYEEDNSLGKDRPLLVVGREGEVLYGLMLSSQPYHQSDPAWFALGAGAWDGEHRPSWVRLDRVLEMPEDGIRREGAILDRQRFDRVAQRLRSEYGWR